MSAFRPGDEYAGMRIQSEFAGEVQVEIRYFTSGITWSADYVAEATKTRRR